MYDRFATLSPSLTSPVTDGFNISPSDSDMLREVTRALFVGGAGDVALKLVSGGQVVLKGVAAGVLIPVRASAVLATGTTASSIVGLV